MSVEKWSDKRENCAPRDMIGEVARVKGLAATSDLMRPYPEKDVMPLATAISMLDALGLRLNVTPKSASQLEFVESNEGAEEAVPSTRKRRTSAS